MSDRMHDLSPELAQVAASVLGVCDCIRRALTDFRPGLSATAANNQLGGWSAALGRAVCDNTVAQVHTADDFRLRSEVLDALGGAADLLNARDPRTAGIALGTLSAAVVASMRFRLAARAAAGGSLHDAEAGALLCQLEKDLSLAEFRHEPLWLIRKIRNPQALSHWFESSPDAHDRSLAPAIAYLAEKLVSPR
ncbi:MAG: hypothetical protein U0136_21435 [Bdellovibrionota bacterium]